MGIASDNLGAKLTGLAAGAAIIGGIALVGLGVKATQMAADFQQAVNRLKTGGGDIQDSFNSLWTGIQKVAVATGVLTGPLSDSMYLIVSAGQRGAQAMTTLTAAAQGAQIEMANVKDVTQILTTIQTDFGIKTHTAAQYMDGLVSAVSHGKITLEDLSTAMSPILPMAGELHIHFADVASAMSDMTNAGIPAAQAATSLRFVFQSMIQPTKASQAAMKEWGLDSAQVAETMKTSLPDALQMYIDAAKRAGPEGSKPFIDALDSMMGGGQRATKALFSLDQTMGQWRSTIGQVNTAMGDTSTNVAGWDTAQSNLNIKLQQGQAMLQTLGQNVGQVILPYVVQLLGAVTPLIGRFGDWFVTSGRLATVIQTLSGWINTATTFVGNLIAALKNNGALTEFWQILQDIGQTVGNVVNAALLTLSGLFGTTSTNAGPAADAANNVAGALKHILDVIKPVTDLLSWLSQQFSGASLQGELLRSALVGIGAAVAAVKIAELAAGIQTAVQFFLALTPAIWGSVTATTALDVAAAPLAGVFVLIGLAVGAAYLAFQNWEGIKGILSDVTSAIGAFKDNVHSALASVMGDYNTTARVYTSSANTTTQTAQQLTRNMEQEANKRSQYEIQQFGQTKSSSITFMNQMRDGVTSSANNMSNAVNQHVLRMHDQVIANAKSMASGVSNSAQAMYDAATSKAQSMALNVAASALNMQQLVTRDFSVTESTASNLVDTLHDNVIGDFSSMDSLAKGYWDDVANYILDNPITGYVDISVAGTSAGPSATVHHYASGTNYAPGGLSWVGEGGQAELVVGPHLMNLPTGAGVYPMSQVGGGGGSGQPVVIQFVVNGRQLAQAALPDFVQAIREATGAKF
jgi:TP901 family phage tail tape measure protein